ncbi:hypothetical protein VTO42DRAFT_218 [Malbranchea cinnamomea]
MDTLRFFVKRDEDEVGLSTTTVNLLISLLALVLFALAIVFVLLVLRRRRRQNQNKSELPLYNDQCSKSHHRNLTISTNRKDSVYVIDEKRSLYENSSSPPNSPVPEIRITFPDEEDASGKRKSGRVVVVRISDKGSIGLEPCDEETLPPYQSNGSDRFQSLDLERMGGLKEKEDSKRWS